MSIPVSTELLMTLPLFHGLTPKELTCLSMSLRYKNIAGGRSLFVMGQVGGGVYIVLNGTVKSYIDQAGGTTVTLDILGPGEVVGDICDPENHGHYANVSTRENSTFLCLGSTDFRNCVQTMPALATNLVLFLAARLRRNSLHTQSLCNQNVRCRVAYRLISLANQYGEPRPPDVSMPVNAPIQIPVRLTQSDLSEMAGASRGRVNQVMNLYKERGIVSVGHGHRITINDYQFLNRDCL